MHSLIEVFCASFVEIEQGPRHINMWIRVILVDRQLKLKNSILEVMCTPVPPQQLSASPEVGTSACKYGLAVRTWRDESLFKTLGRPKHKDKMQLD